MNEAIKKIKEKILAVKHKEILIIVLLAVILLVLMLVDCSAKSDSLTSAADLQAVGYCEKMTTDITDAVRIMTNSNNCKVIINWSDGGENIIAYTTSLSGNGETKTPEIVTVNGVSSPVILKEKYPIAISIAIVCPKSTLIETKLNIKYMVSTLLNTDFDKVAIYSC